jgi:monofunctional biosynthetic peptidoglycan transglycosylase
MAAQGGFWRRLRNLFLWLAGLFVAVTLLSVLALRWVTPVTTAFIVHDYLSAWLDRDLHWHADYRWTPYERISRHVKLAVIASEDQKFAFHPGFDFEAIDAAIRERERGKRLRGASTISQQVAKNLYLWPGQSFVRKGLEAYLTLLIELLWPKQRILEVYLNVAEFGPGIYGVGAAAARFFQTDAAHLTQSQSARLAAVLPSPKRLHVDRPSAYLWRRQAWIIEQMDALGGTSYIQDVRGASR